MKKIIYTYVLNTLADWEIGLAIAELNTQRFFSNRAELEVKTFALNKQPVKTMGGITILPDFELADVTIGNAALLILPGAEEWPKPAHQPVLDLAGAFLKAGIPVAAICGATEALARAGMLNETDHTSNGLDLLKMTCPEYKGGSCYKNELAVTAGNLITAGSSSQTAFAYHILKKINAMEANKLEYWYGYFEDHSTEDILKLVGEI
jgi:putative intracellular protease/amidase